MTRTGTNRQAWVIAAVAAVSVFTAGFAAGIATTLPARTPRASYRAIGGYQSHRIVIDDRSANVYYVAPTGITYVGNMRDAQRPAGWPAVPAEGPR